MDVLTGNAIQLMYDGSVLVAPCLQISAISNFGDGLEHGNRYRVDLSDGIHKQKASLPKKYNDDIDSKRLMIGSILQLTKYIFLNSHGSRRIVILDLEIICTTHATVVEPIFLCVKQEDVVVQTTPPLCDASTQPSTSTKYQGFGRQRSLFEVRKPQNVGSIPTTITPIKNLNPYQPNWSIKGRVLVNKDIYHYNTTKASGDVFSFDIVDREGIETHVTCFNELAKTHYDNIQVGVAYKLSGGAIKLANKIYNKLNNGLEITLVDDSKVTACNDDSSIPKHRYAFIALDQVATINNNSTIDVIGIVISVDLSSTICKRDGTKVPRRTIKLVDMTRTTIDVTLWGAMAKKEGTTFNTSLTIDPLIEELAQLKDWYSQNVHTEQGIFHQLVAPAPAPQRMTISEIQAHASNSEQPFYCILKATIQQIKSKSFFYQACPTQDHTDTIWEIVFDEGAIELMGMPAKTLYMLQSDDNAEQSTADVIKNVTYNQFLLNLTCRNETYNNEEWLKVAITNAKQLDFASENSILLEKIKEMFTDTSL
ncbi:replication protein A 70 kDa DNA-binding subunit A-like [Cryptomeria japonica]|uniref:replication protein A 70 kDa DNA-binding subunit A-like n=1 Tax=Cryptomeria japonica TaxID=3369 RepID=UPI0027DA1BDF|nr:replication protein A 70 kDa DNA-binding subunit A-like [Cryptomeria japonica]